MSVAIVYQYREVDAFSGRVIISFSKLTAEAIAAMGADIIADSEQEVHEGALDSEGRYTPC